MVVDRLLEAARRLRPIVVDGSIGAAIFLANSLPNPLAFSGFYLLVDAAAALSVTLRRRNLVAACGVWGLTAVAGLATHASWTDATADGQALYLAGLILLYSVAERALTSIARVALPASIVIGFILGRGQLRRVDLVYYTFVFVPWIGVAWFAGRAQARRWAIAFDLERSAYELQKERELLVRSAVAAERTEIARDLHALVLRGVKRMNAEAHRARRLLAEDPSRAMGAIAAIEGDGRDALVEMRRLLAVIRVPELAPDKSTGGPPPTQESRDPTSDGGGSGREPSRGRARASGFQRWMPTPWGGDTLPVLALAVMGVAEHVFASRIPLGKGMLGCCNTIHATLWIAAMVGVLLWRGVAPLVVLGLVAALNFIPYEFANIGGIAWTGDMAVALAAYAVGAFRGPRWGIVAFAVVALSYSAVGGHVHFDWWMVDWAVNLGLAVVAGLAVNRSRELSAELTEQAETLRRTREERVRLAVVQERLRIARDVHDLVAHGLTIMVIQAGAAAELVATNPRKADQALHSVERAGQEALDELDALLGDLGSAPSAGVEALPSDEHLAIRSLVDQQIQAGMHVELVIRGEPHPVAAGLEVSLYRIVQEALTNVRKHAPGARVWVDLRYTPEGVEVDVVDVGGGVPDSSTFPGGGQGLVGIAERAALFGGRVEYGPDPAGGFRVHVALVEAPALV